MTAAMSGLKSNEKIYAEQFRVLCSEPFGGNYNLTRTSYEGKLLKMSPRKSELGF